MNIARGLRFLRRYLISNPRYAIRYLFVFRRSGYVFDTHLLSEEELTSQLAGGRSLIRIGDGEINLMLGLKNHYQAFAPELKKGMFELVHRYRADGPYVLAVPRFITLTNDELKSMGKFNVWLPLKVMFDLHFNQKLPYLDAHSFYYDGYFERTVGKAIAEKHIVLITNEQTISKQRMNTELPWKKLSFLPVPAEESLTAFSDIQNSIDAAIASYHKEETVLLFAMGPVGKILALKYAEQGVQSIDIGKVAEVMFTGESIAYIV